MTFPVTIRQPDPSGDFWWTKIFVPESPPELIGADDPFWDDEPEPVPEPSESNCRWFKHVSRANPRYRIKPFRAHISKTEKHKGVDLGYHSTELQAGKAVARHLGCSLFDVLRRPLKPAGVGEGEE